MTQFNFPLPSFKLTIADLKSLEKLLTHGLDVKESKLAIANYSDKKNSESKQIDVYTNVDEFEKSLVTSSPMRIEDFAWGVKSDKLTIAIQCEDSTDNEPTCVVVIDGETVLAREKMRQIREFFEKKKTLVCLVKNWGDRNRHIQYGFVIGFFLMMVYLASVYDGVRVFDIKQLAWIDAPSKVNYLWLNVMILIPIYASLVYIFFGVSRLPYSEIEIHESRKSKILKLIGIDVLVAIIAEVIIISSQYIISLF